LPAPIYADIQKPGPNSKYGFGWIIVQRDWAGGKALCHTGSNTMNFCNCWLAPAKKFGVLVCMNQGGGKTFNASDDAAEAMISLYTAKLNHH
jgi:D-alanyl-D-alanine carboxypeptidase